MSGIEYHIAKAQHAGIARDGEEEGSRCECPRLTSASAQTNRTERRITNLEMGGAAQYISIALMIVFEGIGCDNEAIVAHEVKRGREG